jgi:hypothetical protein
MDKNNNPEPVEIQIEQLRAAIAAQETLRSIVGDRVVDIAF